MAMDFVSMMEAKLPPGFRFHPRDEELILDYLTKRINGVATTTPMMVDVDLNKVEPWDLPEIACVGGKEWYFYSLRDRKYATGQRTNRATLSGYWKATGKDRSVVDGRRGGKLVGMRKTLVFYQGRAPKGKKSDWVMHEFRMEGDSGDRLKPPPSSSSSSTKEDWVICRVFYKTRGHQYSMKPNTTTTLENCYDDTGSSSLPPLMDTYINFEQPQPLPNVHGYEHVPCFSNLQNPTSTSTATFRPPPPPPNKPMQPNFSQIPDLGQANYLSYSCEKKAIKDVLEQLSKAEDRRRPTGSLAEGSSERYLTETGGAHPMWNPFSAS